MQPFLALITPLGGSPQPPGYPTHPWVPPYGPSHPIAPGGPPPGIWGPIGNYPDAGFPGPQPGQPPRPWGPINYPDQGLPGYQPYPDNSLPGNQPYPDQGLPGFQPRPTHPIYYPPYPTTGPGFPTAPIVLPPEELPPQPVGPDKMVIAIFVPGLGYKVMVVSKPPGYAPPTGPSTEIPTPQ